MLSKSPVSATMTLNCLSWLNKSFITVNYYNRSSAGQTENASAKSRGTNCCRRGRNDANKAVFGAARPAGRLINRGVVKKVSNQGAIRGAGTASSPQNWLRSTKYGDEAVPAPLLNAPWVDLRRAEII